MSKMALSGKTGLKIGQNGSKTAQKRLKTALSGPKSLKTCHATGVAGCKLPTTAKMGIFGRGRIDYELRENTRKMGNLDRLAGFTGFTGFLGAWRRIYCEKR
jgi:hypothetical protein